MKNKLGNYVKESREKESLSQRELARKANIDNAIISRIEDGTTKKPSSEIIFKLCKTLKLDFLYMLQLAGYTKTEIFQMTSIGIELYFNDRALGLIGKEAFKDYTYENDIGVFLDIGKILDNYKNGKISLEDTVKLISCCQPFDYGENGERIYFSSKGDIIIEA